MSLPSLLLTPPEEWPGVIGPRVKLIEAWHNGTLRVLNPSCKVLNIIEAYENGGVVCWHETYEEFQELSPDMLVYPVSEDFRSTTGQRLESTVGRQEQF